MSVLSTLAQTTVVVPANSSADTGAAILAVLLGLFLITIPITIGLYIFGAIVLSKLFKKAGMKETWPAWVPIYNVWKLLEITGYPGWLILAALGGSIILNVVGLGWIISIAFSILLAIAVNRAFGKKDNIGWILFLFFLPLISHAVLAFGDSKYKKPTEKDLLFKI